MTISQYRSISINIDQYHVPSFSCTIYLVHQRHCVNLDLVCDGDARIRQPQLLDGFLGNLIAINPNASHHFNTFNIIGLIEIDFPCLMFIEID